VNRTRQPWTDAERESLRVVWYDTAWTHTEIAQSLRRPRNELLGMARLLRLGTRPRVRQKSVYRKWTVEEQDRFEQMLDAGVTHWDIARALTRSVKAITLRAERYRRAKPQPIAASHLAELARRGINVSYLRR
jgi:hypothetical protein